MECWGWGEGFASLQLAASSCASRPCTSLHFPPFRSFYFVLDYISSKCFTSLNNYHICRGTGSQHSRRDKQRSVAAVAASPAHWERSRSGRRPSARSCAVHRVSPGCLAFHSEAAKKGDDAANCPSRPRASWPPGGSAVLYCIVLEGNRELLGVSAPRRPSVRADPQGMQPG